MIRNDRTQKVFGVGVIAPLLSAVFILCFSSAVLALPQVSIDVNPSTSAPSVRAVLSGDTGLNGWFVRDISLRWEITNHGVAVTSIVDSDPATLSGNIVDTTSMADRDKRNTSAPSVRAVLSGDMGLGLQKL